MKSPEDFSCSFGPGFSAMTREVVECFNLSLSVSNCLSGRWIIDFFVPEET